MIEKGFIPDFPKEAVVELASITAPAIPRTSPSTFPDGIRQGLSRPADAHLYELNTVSVLDFANQRDFGYVQDRHHVAGFQPHAFSQIPASPKDLIVETVDLVSLLLHGEPVAYVSADLPRMDELREAPTRPLDAFETPALDRLRDGEDLLTTEAGTYLRMLGSIRSAKQCVQCHGGERGDLLGAFSYTLQKKQP